MTEFRYDTQLLIEGHDLDEDAIYDYFVENFKGDCLLAVGDEELIKIHFHTNEPWKVLEYCASSGEIFDIVVEITLDENGELKVHVPTGSIVSGNEFYVVQNLVMLPNFGAVTAEEYEDGYILIPDGSGGFIMCPECNKCSQCDKVGKWEFDSLHAVHIESFCDEEDDDDKVFDIKSDVTNDSTYLEAEEIADMIADELHKIKPKYAVIFREMYSGTLKPKQIAVNTGLKVSTTYEDVEKVMAKAQELFSLLMK